jgi:hypothetical protein
VALMGFRRPTWVPVLDLAMTDLRVRDVGTADTPLIGLPGRIGTLDEQGSHPGPLSFYLLAPVYRLLGSSAWALQVGTVAIHAAAIATSLWLAGRRGGPRLMLAVAVALALLMGGYGVSVLSEPWNPYLPLLWWTAGLLAVWSVLCGDVRVLPVAVFALSLGAQTHIPYLGLGLGMGALATGGALWWARGHPDERREVIRWALVALAVGVVLWAPPTIDQLIREPGNYGLLVDHFVSPSEEQQGPDTGVRTMLEHLDPVYHAQTWLLDPGGVVEASPDRDASAVRGGVFAVAWAVTAIGALRLRNRALSALHMTVAAGMVLGVFAIGRVFGRLWFYLSLWAWSIAVLAAVAMAWTVVLAVRRRAPGAGSERALRLAAGGVALVGIVAVAHNAIEARDAPHSDADVVAMAASVVPPTAAALDEGIGAATGDDGTYLVSWSDALHIGSPGYALLNELERRGFDVGAVETYRVPATPHRVIDPGEATARVHLATGRHVETMRALPEAVEVAYADLRSPEERAELDRLRQRVVDDLEAAGMVDLVSEVDYNLFRLAVEERVPESIRRMVDRMLELGGPAAVFVLPSDVPLPSETGA